MGITMNIDWIKFLTYCAGMALVVFWMTVMFLTLTGCEILDEQETPLYVECRATCEKCENVELICDGTGRSTVNTTTKVNKP